MKKEPFDGAEGSNYNPYQYSRIGTIIEVLDNNKMVDGKQYNQDAYMTVRIRWMDRGGDEGNFNTSTGLIHLLSPHVSRGHGFFYKPSKGDMVACSFRMGGYAVIEGFIPANYYNKVNGKDEKGYTFRNIQEDGEYVLKSKRGAEVYLDKAGSLHLLTRDQTQTSEVTINNSVEDIKETIVDDNPEVHIVVGKTYNFKTVGNSRQVDFNSEVKSSTGNSTRLSIQDYTSGVKIIIDSVGSLEIVQPSGSTFKVTGSDSAEVLGSESLALKSDVQQLRDDLNTFISNIYNTHMHPTAGTGSPSLPTATGSSPSSPQGTSKLKGS
jgi:hypothetical protein